VIVSVRNIEFCYQRVSQPTLCIPEWGLQAKEKVFLHGPSGTGKSTLLNLLAGILTPNSGSIHVMGQTINTLSRAQRDQCRAQHIGMVFQQFNLIPYLSAIDNIRLAAHFGNTPKSTARAIELLDALGLSTEQQQQTAATLSIGQQQRVAIARALINRPALLLVDEPSSALDRANRDSFMTLLFDQLAQQDTALLFVSHDLALAKDFERVDDLTLLNTAHLKQTCSSV